MTHKDLVQTENQFADKHDVHLVAGLDEVGRGAIAGPLVVCCAVRDVTLGFPDVQDSKVLTAQKRELLVPHILDAVVNWSIGIVEAQEINSHGMTWAVPEAFQRAYDGLQVTPDMTLYDGRPMQLHTNNPQAVIKGDATYASIAAASILAKVIRDLFMQALDGDYPAYGFAKHKGYGAAEHFKAVFSHGMLPKIHRTAFIHRQGKLW